MPDQKSAAQDMRVSENVAARPVLTGEPRVGADDDPPSDAHDECETSDQSQSYSGAQIALHWLIAALVLAQLIINDAVRLAFRDRLAGAEDASLGIAVYFHLASGLAILALTLLRLGLRLVQGAPPPPKGGPVLFEWMGKLAHWGLYGLLLAMTISGAAAWFALSPIFGTLHESLRFALIGLILAHILGALVEHYVFGNRVIRRMLSTR